jgi:hypothetical protein
MQAVGSKTTMRGSMNTSDIFNIYKQKYDNNLGNPKHETSN